MIELRHVCKTYGQRGARVVALEDVNISVERGGFLAIMGPSGSGKSTLMNIIGCLDDQTSGTYRLNGREIVSLNADQKAMMRNKTIGFVFQSFFLLPRLSAFENIELPMLYGGVPPRQRARRVQELLELVGLTARASHLPSQLSGGQCQRVAIARAMANCPNLLLADEPTGNLDSKTSIEIMELFSQCNAQGTTVVLITHEPEIAKFAQDVVYLRDGRIQQ